MAAAACVALMIGTIPLVKHFNTPAGTGTTGGVVQGTTGGVVNPSVIKLGNKLTAYDMGPHAGGTSLGAENSVEFKAGTIERFYDNAKDGEKKTIKINGKTYTGVYQTSIESPYYNDDTDVYNISENGKVVQHFEINRATGMLTNFHTDEGVDKLAESIYDEKECYAIAQDFLKTIVDDLDEYELCKSGEVSWRNAYHFTLRKIVNGIPTSERITIGVAKDGKIFTFTVLAHDAMDNVDASAITQEMIDKVVSEKVAAIYRKNPDVTYEYDEIILIRCRDGSFYIDCDIKIQGIELTTGNKGTESCYIAITIE